MSKTTKLLIAVSLLLVLVIGCSKGPDRVNGPAVPTAERAVKGPAADSVVSATLHVWAATNPTTGATTDVYRVTTSWDQATVTWANFGEAYDSSKVWTSFPNNSYGWETINITDLVNAWLAGTYQNFGLLLDEGVGAPRIDYKSSEYPDDKPFVVLTFSGGAVDTIMVAQDASINQNNDTAHYGPLELFSTGLIYSTFEKQALIYFPLETPPCSGSLGDFVWYDKNGNGEQDDGEEGVPNDSVWLFDCQGELMAKTVTDASGHYLFGNLGAGSYVIKYGLPAGYKFTLMDVGNGDLDSDADSTGKTVCVSLAACSSDMTLDAGIVAVAECFSEVGDFVWYDVNGNGLQDVGETGVPNDSVWLLNCQGTVLQRTVTDANGHYLFTGLKSDYYKVRWALPSGYKFTLPHVIEGAKDSDADSMGYSPCFPVDSCFNELTIDAGIVQVQECKSALGDFVWYDQNGNGLQDQGEPGVPNDSVWLMDCESNVIEATVTDMTGHYLFDNLEPGSYMIAFGLPAGYLFTKMDAGDGTIDSDADSTGTTVCLTLAACTRDMTIDAGIVKIVVPEEGCTRTIGYWKNHAGFGPQADVVTQFLPISLGSFEVTTAKIAYDVLTQKVYGTPSNGITKLMAQLLAAKLNIAAGASDADVAATIAAADAFLSTHSYTDWSSLTAQEKAMVLDWQSILDAYNNGMIGPGHCDD